MSLVADYGTSESDSDSSSDSENSETKPEDQPNKNSTSNSAEKLPTPAFGNSSTSVFSNPFIEAENAKKAILEKHVKMVPTKEETKVINGKKICWNYRKGRCRFGHNCSFAHDSDLQKTPEELEEANKVQTSVICQNNQNTPEKIPEEYNKDNVSNKKKKRPGLTQGLVPGTKVMKLFHKQDKNAANWPTHL